MSTPGTPIPDDVRAAAVADYLAGTDSLAVVGARYGISKAALHYWVKGPPPGRIRQDWREDDIALVHGEWIPNSRGIRVWQPRPRPVEPPCPRCGVTDGQWCRTRNGRQAGVRHADREYA